MSDRLEALKNSLPDRYEIEKELGHGGMAHVYLARDVREGRQVAVKVVRPEIAAVLDPDRFLRQIGAVTHLAHPSILPVLEVGVSGSTFFYVMPYVAAGTLRHYIDRQGRLSIEGGVGILRGIVEALAFAHAGGVVHLDINAANVFLPKERAVVADFGLAATKNDSARADRGIPLQAIVGSPAYMSPEQATAASAIDHRSDIYSVGALAYELFSGAAPFTGPDPETVLEAHVDLAAPPLTERRPLLPPDLNATIMKCLEKDPADRWQTAAEMLPHLTFKAGAPEGAGEKRFLTSRKSNAPAILIVLTSFVLLMILLAQLLP